jgi:AraC family transcriptional regulator, ethanolamine operon transcriptional activator
VSVLRITDPTAVGDVIEVYDMDVVNLDSEKFEYTQVTVPLEKCILIYQHTNAAMRTQSSIHEGFESCFVLGPNSVGSFDGVEMQPYSMIAAGPAAHAELIVDGDFGIIGFLVPPHVLDEHLALRDMQRNFSIPVDPEVRHPDTEVALELFELGLSIAETAEKSPGVFNDNHWARHGAQVEFMDALLATIESCDTSETPDTNRTARSYSRIVRACEDYTLNLDGRRPYLSELCATANVSERTLQKAFNSIMGMSPLTYLHRLRLHRARDELRKATIDSTSVTDVALNWGFWHFGEFSRAYKNCFGEVPSATLKQS